jgi:hypothetical protein
VETSADEDEVFGRWPCVEAQPMPREVKRPSRPANRRRVPNRALTLIVYRRAEQGIEAEGVLAVRLGIIRVRSSQAHLRFTIYASGFKEARARRAAHVITEALLEHGRTDW